MLTDTIVAGNTGSLGGPSDIGGNQASLVTGTYNLIGTGGSGGIAGSSNVVLTSLADLDLAPLNYYGGPTRTIVLLPGSAAIGVGTAVSGVTTDERGFPVESSIDIGAFQVQSGPLVVNTSADGSGCPLGALDLRGAVDLADVLPGAHTITFDQSVFATRQTITLTQGQLELSDTSGTETIMAPEAGVTVSGGGNSGVFQIDSNVTVSMSGLTISGGSTTGNGGGLENYGTATLTDCMFSNDTADGSGGGIENHGTLSVSSTTFTDDSTGTYGGGVNNDGSIIIAGCTFDSDSSSISGGGYSAGGTGTITDCTFSNDSANNVGGGINDGAPITITNCTFTDDSAGNNGGGIEIYFFATATVSNCTFTRDSAVNYGGGGINSGSTTLTNCTVSGDSAGNGGGGLMIDGGTTTLTNCTVSDNSAGGEGGGLCSYSPVTATLADTIVAGNTGSLGGPSDIGGSQAAQVTGSYNLIGTGGSGGITGGSGGNIVLTSLTDLGLAPLDDYGGTTETMALLPGSAAIGAGTATSGVMTDQRGASRPTSGAVDVGAFQDQGYTVAVSSGSPQSTLVSQPFNASLVALLTEDFANAPLPGATIGFSAPSSDASATLGASSAVTDANGLASVTATANATAGTMP